MPTDPKRVQAVFLAAVELLATADRAALLDREGFDAFRDKAGARP